MISASRQCISRASVDANAGGDTLGASVTVEEVGANGLESNYRDLCCERCIRTVIYIKFNQHIRNE